jgi:hypothetical protein
MRSIRIAATLAVLLATGAAFAKPPPWAPAHGYRAKHQYIYYPQAEVYRDHERGVWFYYENGRWRIEASLPVPLRQFTVGGVTIGLDTDKPYERHDEIRTYYAKEKSDAPPRKKGKKIKD